MLNKIYWAAFSLLWQNKDTKPLLKIISNNTNAYIAWHNLKECLIKHRFSSKYIKLILEKQNSISLDKIVHIIKNENIKILTYNDKIYPSLLKEIYSPPICLFYYGNINILKNYNNNISIVGTRKHSLDAKFVINDIINFLKNYPCQTISGLALGIDTLVHTNSLKNNIPTIAILGTPLEKSNVYPNENYMLSKIIIEKNGLIISEYINGFNNNRKNFLARNRIIAGLSKLTIIIEAPKRSGAINTAYHALNSNRNILVVPNNIYLSSAMGSNNLIKLGAYPLLSPCDILNFWNK